MTLTEFLLARIAEDEAAAETSFDPQWTAHPEMAGQPIIDATGHRLATAAETVMAHIARHDPARVVAECEAQRRIVAAGPSECDGYTHQIEGGAAHYPDPDYFGYCDGCAAAESADAVWRLALTALATVHASHPDYDEAWRP